MNNNYGEVMSLISEANSLLQKNQISDAQKIYNKVLNMDSDNAFALMGKSFCHFYKSEFNLARKLAQKARDINETIVPREYYEILVKKSSEPSYNNSSSEILNLLNEASSFLNKNKVDEAINIFDKVLSTDKKNVTAIYGKSVCYYMKGEFNKAKYFASKARMFDKNSVPSEYYNNLLSQIENSRRSSENSHSHKSDSLKAKEFLTKGLGLIKSGNYDEAILIFKDVLNLEPDNSGAKVGIGYCYYCLGDIYLAKRMCDDVWRSQLKGSLLKYYDKIMIGNTSNSSRRGSGSSSRRNTSGSSSRRNTSGSSSGRNRSGSTSRNSSSHKSDSLKAKEFLTKGLGLIKSGNYDEAILIFNEVLNLEPDNSGAKVGIGYCHYCLGDIYLAKRMCDDVWRSQLKGSLLKYYDKIMIANTGNSSRRGSGSSSGRNTSGSTSRNRSGSSSGRNRSGSTSGNSSSYKSDSLKAKEFLTKGLGLIKSGNYDEAILIFNEVLNLEPDNSGAKVGIGYCYYCLGDIYLAKRMCDDVWRSQLKGSLLKYYDKIMIANTGNSSRRGSGSSSGRNSSSKNNSLLQSALTLLLYSNYKAAKSSFEEVLSDDPNNSNAIVGKAYCLYKWGHVVLSARLCKRVSRFDLDKNFQYLYDEMAVNFANSDGSSSRSSESSFGGSGSSSRASGSNSSSNYQVNKLCDDGFKHMERYEIKDALVCFKKAVKLDSGNVRAIEGLAQCLYNLGYYIPALNKYEEALNINSDAVDYEFYRKVKIKAEKLI